MMNVKEILIDKYNTTKKPTRTHTEGETKEYFLNKFISSSKVTIYVVLGSLMVVNFVLVGILKRQKKDYVRY